MSLKHQTQRQKIDHTKNGALNVSMTQTFYLGEASKMFCAILLESPMEAFINVTMIKISYKG